MILQVGEVDYHVIGRGEMADRLAVVPAGSVIDVKGPLVTDMWETGDSKRFRVVVHVERAEVLYQPGKVMEGVA